MSSLRALFSSSDTSILCHLACPTHFLSNQLKTPLKIHPHLPSMCMPLASSALSPRTPQGQAPRAPSTPPHKTPRWRSVGGGGGAAGPPSDCRHQALICKRKSRSCTKGIRRHGVSTRPSPLSHLLLAPLTSPPPPPAPATTTSFQPALGTAIS